MSNVSPEEAHALLAQGYVYLDVRTEAEFELGHPPGAVNVPISLSGAGGMAPNADFVPVMEGAFGRDARLVVGCKAGGRTRRAATALRAAGFTNVLEMPAGWDGGRDEFGRPLAGWRQKGLPAETGQPADQSYAAIRARRA